MPPPSSPIQIVFVHLDLGIGGAEQLVLNLANASLQAGHDVHIVTANCRQDHCFSIVKQPHGALCDRVKVWGHWIPPSVLGVGTALCSTLRLLYLSAWTTCVYAHADLVVLDVLPTPIFILRPYTSVLFYSHFPDKLLTRDTVNGEESGEVQLWWKVLYRNILDRLEEHTMSMADVLVVNSIFTQTQVQRVFSSLRNTPMRVLYPALQKEKDKLQTQQRLTTQDAPIVSLNRFERKKNIQLLLHAYALLQDNHKKLPPLIVAGGYDVTNVENVEYSAELQALSDDLNIQVTFLRSISDDTRKALLQQALCVVYTPHLEHFGIVPLEAMAAGTPVVAVNSGGPKETVVDGVTGYLCHATPQAFCQALEKFCKDPQLAKRMGEAGRVHVFEKFGPERFQQEWIQLVEETIVKGRQRRMTRQYAVYKGGVYLLEAMVALLCVLLATYALRAVGVIASDAHIVPSIKRALSRGEL